MNLFEKAVIDYFNGSRNNPLHFTYTGISTQKTKKNIKRYFRKYWQLTGIEKKLISMVRGKTLDIGCATGYYIPYMQKKSEVIGIDISDYLIKICHKKGLNNCIKQDIYEYETDEKFDTITLLESNIGLGGNEERLHKLLIKIKSLLKKSGQVLCIQNNFEADYLDCDINISYEGKEDTIKWSYMNMYYLRDECKKLGFNFQVIAYGKGNVYLARLTL